MKLFKRWYFHNFLRGHCVANLSSHKFNGINILHSEVYLYDFNGDIFVRLLCRESIISRKCFIFDILRYTCMFSMHLPATSQIHIFANSDLIGKSRKISVRESKTFRVTDRYVIVSKSINWQVTTNNVRNFLNPPLNSLLLL